MRFAVSAVLAAAWLSAATSTASAQAKVELNGYASGSYSVNANHPASGINQLRVFDFDDRELKLDLVELVVQRPITKPGEFGFRIDADAGQSMPRITAATGLFRNPEGKAGNFDLREVILSYILPLGAGLRLDAGKFVTHIGLDVIDGVDGYNGNATRGFLFGYGEPYTHTGLKATYALAGTVNAMVQVSRGWDDVRDNNKAPSCGAQLAFTPSDSLALSVNVMAGPERAGNTSDARLLMNVVGTWKASPAWSFGMDALWGTERNAAGPGVDGRWAGAAVTARREFGGPLAVILRGEFFDDAHGDRTGAPQTLSAVTLTPEITITRHLLVRSDLRLDHSTTAVFETRTAAGAYQGTMLVSAIVHF